jgi:nucleoid DNA-binding protein
MNKPQSMSHKDFLIRTLAVKLSVNEKMIEAIINHQFQSANEAMDLNHSVEISGFGKFMLNVKKAHRKMANLIKKRDAFQATIDDINKTDAERKKASVVVSKTNDQINLLKPTIDNND